MSLQNKRVVYALEHFIKDGYFLGVADSYSLEETKDTGRSKLALSVSGENLCIDNVDTKKNEKNLKCAFTNDSKDFGLNKAVDHVVFQCSENGWIIHLIEMKTSVGNNTWENGIKLKFRSSYLDMLALAVFLRIKVWEVRAYTTYENEKFDSSPAGTADLAKFKPRTGERYIDPYKDEWDKNKIYLDFGATEDDVKLAHTKIKMKRVRIDGDDSKSCLIGSLSIS